MGINRLLLDSQIQGFWHGYSKTSRDWRRDTPPGQGPGGVCKYYIGPIGDLSLSTATAAG